MKVEICSSFSDLMAGTPCGRVVCDKPGPRPDHSGTIIDVPDVLVFMEKDGKNFHLVPSYLTQSPKEVGKTRHQQAIEIIGRGHQNFFDYYNDQLNKSANNFIKENIEQYEKNVYQIQDVKDCSAAGAILNKEPKTQSCTVNNFEGNSSQETEGQMNQKSCDKFLDVFKQMKKFGLDMRLKEVIEKKIPETIQVIGYTLKEIGLIEVLARTFGFRDLNDAPTVTVHQGDYDYENGWYKDGDPRVPGEP